MASAAVGVSTSASPGRSARGMSKDHAKAWRERMASRSSAVLAAADRTVVVGASGGRASSSLTVAASASGSAGMTGDGASRPNDTNEGFETPFPDAPRASSGDDADDAEDSDAPKGREMCWRCRRVQRLCVCGVVRSIVGDSPIDNKLGITVLQDRIEALKRPFGSAIVAELALEDCTSVWFDTSVPEVVPRPKHLPNKDVGVLWPAPDAATLRRATSNEEGADVPGDGERSSDAGGAPPKHLVVIDTTWHRAKRMYNRIPWVRELPAYVLGENTSRVQYGESVLNDGPAAGEDSKGDSKGEDRDENAGNDSHFSSGNQRRESAYRIRKQPRPGFLSTAECIAAALREAEPAGDDDGFESPGAAGERAARAVEACFDEMIERQIKSFSDPGVKSVRYRSRKRERAAKEAARRAKIEGEAKAREGLETLVVAER